MNLQKLNLSDLHCHLGAAVSARALWEIAHEQGIALPKEIKNYWNFMESIKLSGSEPHDKYLDRFKITHEIQSSPLAVERSIHHAISHAYTKCNITTLEIRMNPLLRTNNKKYDADMIIFHACMAMKKTMMIYPIRVGLILSIERSFSSKEAEVIASKAIKYKPYGVIGIDVSGKSPKNFKVSTFYKAFKMVRDAGMNTTFHTGEVTGANEMMKVMKKIKPDRIGHGVRCVEDEELMELLVARNVILEICPTSNLKLGVVKDIDHFHRIFETLRVKGVKFCINSDGPVFLNSSVNDELLLLHNNKIFNGKEIVQIVRDSHKYTFIQ